MAQEPRQEYQDAPSPRSVWSRTGVTAKQMLNWRPIRRQILWAVLISSFLVALLTFILLGYVFSWEWTGFPQKRLFDWIQILVIPIAIAIGTYVLNRAATRRDDEAQQEQKRRERETQQEQREREVAIEVRREEEASLQAYLNYISQMLTDPDRPLHRSHLSDNLSVVARAQTLTVLGRLQDGLRKTSILQFLYEAGLINKNHPVISLEGAAFHEVDLRGADLHGAYLTRADLRGAYLEEASLEGAHLYGTNLKGADLQNANLGEATLRMAHLEEANLFRIYLRGADLYGASLSGAVLYEADLIRADLRGAYLTRADLREIDLANANLERANLNGSKLRKAILYESNLSRANLQRVDLVGGDLRGANLEEANLEGARIFAAYLGGADLQNAKHLTQEQIEQALGDKNTKLPASLKTPKTWSNRRPYEPFVPIYERWQEWQ